ncbi:MAG: Acyl-homoserine-lactone synthase VanM [Candidatus Celerinatantimonas neptuna]|nr:MAG: Acyl-homoserine-lactone synthase VanM [Candidatus Celerinatantimonas neptuna]
MPAVSIECYVENSAISHEQLFSDIREQFKEDDIIHSFNELVTLRKNELIQIYPGLRNGNLATIFEAPQSINHIKKQAIKSINLYWHHLEKTAIELFGDILACWAHYERFCILHKYKAIPISLFSNVPYDESKYRSEMIDRIENDERKFYTLYCNASLTLTDANTLININSLIIDQKWYEMLFSISLSQESRHFILYYTDNYNRLVLVSASLIQGWDKRKKWLSFEPFFQGKHWKSCITEDSRSKLYHLGIFNDLVLNDNITLWFEDSLKDYIKDPSNVCEIVRFSVCGSKYLRLFLLYFAQKELMKRLVESHFYVSYMITDQPFFMSFYQSTDDICYIIDSYRSIQNSKYYIFKGFLDHKTVGDKLTRSNFKEFRLAAIKSLRNKDD